MIFKTLRTIIIRVLVFAVVAVGTAFLVNKYSNKDMDKVSTEMEEARLPIVFCEYNGAPVNLMRGYTQVMNTRLMRDGIVPMDENHSVVILVYDDSEYGSKYTYELRTIEGDSLIEEGDAIALGDRGGYAGYQINFRMDMDTNKEYTLVFKIESEDGQVANYYSRVVELKEEHADVALEYVKKFHDTSFVKEYDEETGNIITEAIKTTAEGKDGNLAHVNLNSSYDMISYGNLSPTVVTAVIPTITELDSEYIGVSMAYVLYTNIDAKPHYYRIMEKYSARYDKDKEEVNLLAFDRYQETIFDGELINKERNSISFGIADMESSEYLTAGNNRLVAFVREGQLWLYDYSTMNLTSVYDLIQGRYSNLRTLNSETDINIVNMDDNGNIYFVVYGYFNRGEHEGQNGISFYYYEAEDASIEERCFISCAEPFSVMHEDIGKFTYYDDAGYLYYLLSGTIYKVDLSRVTQDIVCTGIPSYKYLVAGDRHIVVYPNSNDAMSVTGLNFINFKTGTNKVIQGSESDRFLGVDFVDNDLVYGEAKKLDVKASPSGETIMPLHSIYVCDEEGEVVKTYNKSGIYIMGVNKEDENLYLKRAVKTGDYFTETEPDYISYKKKEKTSAFTFTYNDDDIYGKCLDVVFPSNMYVSEGYNPVMVTSRSYEGYNEMNLDPARSEDAFYVFENKGYKGEYQSAGSAITAVNLAKSGLVVDGDGNTIYRKIDAVSYNTVADFVDETPCENIRDSKMTCAYMCIEMINPKADYKEILSEQDYLEAFDNHSDGVGINISGIDLDTALYFLDRDIPFTARIDDGRYVLVISYNSTHIRYYDPTLGEEVKVTREAFETSLAMWSNEMYTYTSQ